ncbi:MAG: hypothetical protein M1358_23005 [Chloroflexi bacterium]|nr:hypothetical protein [Chloroflexota bacterium]
MEKGTVRYEVVRDYGDEYRVLQDIALSNEKCTREGLVELGRQFTRDFKDKHVVVLSIFDDTKAVLDGSRQPKTESGIANFTDHLRALYVGNTETGLHELVVYPDQERMSTPTVRYSYCLQGEEGW